MIPTIEERDVTREVRERDWDKLDAVKQELDT